MEKQWMSFLLLTIVVIFIMVIGAVSINYKIKNFQNTRHDMDCLDKVKVQNEVIRKAIKEIDSLNEAIESLLYKRLELEKAIKSD